MLQYDFLKKFLKEFYIDTLKNSIWNSYRFPIDIT